MIFNLEENEVKFIIAALGKQPMETVEPLVINLRQQAANQPEPEEEEVEQ